MFDGVQRFRLRDAMSDEERKQVKALDARLGSPVKIRLGVFHGDQCVGWSWGFQESALRFYMCNSAILPEHRRQGLYTKLLQAVVERAEQLGFQEIYSRHVATNNAVIIPKLKAGFVMTAMEVNDLFGTLVHLTYYPNPLRKKVLDYRVGQVQPDDEIKRHVELSLD